MRLVIFLKKIVPPFLIGAVLVLGLLGVIGGILLLQYWSEEYSFAKSPGSVRVATPPMGWNGWNHFGCEKLDEATINQTVDALVSRGYKSAGYQYVILDDCWQVARDADGNIQVDKTRFPNGLSSISDYIHSKGLKFGIYTSAGRETCKKRPGSYGYEEQDFKQYLEWNVDYIKLDWCGADSLQTEAVYQKWRDMIDGSSRPIVLSVATANMWSNLESQSWLWSTSVGDMRRTATDLADDWLDMLRVFSINQKYEPYQFIGGWNDADVLQVGNGGMTYEEYRTHFGLWTMMSSPLVISSDVRQLDAEIANLLTNPTAIAINQDSLGLQGSVVAKRNAMWVVSKPLKQKGSRAVLVLNSGDKEDSIWLKASDLKLFDAVLVQDVWPSDGKRLQAGDSEIVLPPHASRLMIVRGIDTEENLVSMVPQLLPQARSGSLVQQVAQDMFGLFQYDPTYLSGLTLPVANNSSFGYYLNGYCQKFASGFEFVRSEGMVDGKEPQLHVQVYLDGRLVSDQQVTPAVQQVQFDINVVNSRVIDLVTRASTNDASVVYGRWNRPRIECAGM